MSEHDIEKQGGWLLPETGKKKIAPGLHLVSTPIGNLEDISFRALNTLAAADLVLCEDTRMTGKLLSHYGIKAKLMPYNDHSDDRHRTAIVRELQEGVVIALVSDAGTPLISDPGFKLLRDCRQAGIHVTSVPGANAPLTALQLSGFPSDRFCFLGFLPPKEKARRDMLKDWADVPATLIAFETAPRLTRTLKDIVETLPAREVSVVREITKLYEEARRGMPEALAEYYKSNPPKGEIVLLIGPPSKTEYSIADLETKLTQALKTMSTKEAAKHIAEQTGEPRKKLYDLSLKLAGGGK